MRSPLLLVRSLLALLLVAGGGTVAVAVAGSAGAATCSDVDVVFARGTGEPAGLGTVGTPFARSLTADLSGRTVSTYAVNYAANAAQTSAGAGATDMSNHISSVAASFPGTRFVIGGYSQGATVTDIAVGIRTQTGGTGTPIPAALAPRVAAVVVFGNPLGLQRQTIAQASPTYASRSRDYCNSSDSVCGGYMSNGTGSHTSYASNGATTAGATFAAGLVGAATPTPTPTSTSSPTSSPTSTPTSSPTATATCVRASTSSHVAAGRAVSVFGQAYARGTNDRLGSTSVFNTVSLRQNSTNNWSLVASC